jgi:hypothetical protein
VSAEGGVGVCVSAADALVSICAAIRVLSDVDVAAVPATGARALGALQLDRTNASAQAGTTGPKAEKPGRDSNSRRVNCMHCPGNGTESDRQQTGGVDSVPAGPRGSGPIRAGRVTRFSQLPREPAGRVAGYSQVRRSMLKVCEAPEVIPSTSKRP